MLESYLEGLRAESVGQEFSVDLQAQARKMSALVEQEPALWILLAVQAAVRSRAPLVKVFLTRETMEIRFVPKLEADLRQALLAALALASRGVSLFLGRDALYGQGFPGREGEIRLLLRRQPTPWYSFVDKLAGRIHRTVYRRCGLSSVPIYLDGRLVNQGWLEEVGLFPATTMGGGFGDGGVKHRWLAQASWLAEVEPRFPLTCPLLRSSYRTQIGAVELEAWPRLGEPYAPYESAAHHTVHTARPVEKREWSGDSEDSAWTVARGMFSQELDEATAVGLGIWSRETGRVTFYYLEADELTMPQFSRKVWPSRVNWAAVGCGRWLGLAAREDEPGGLHYIKDGVLLNPVACGSFAGTTAIVADAEVETDLSGLGVVVNDRVRSDSDWVVEQEARLLQDCRAAVFETREGERARLPMAIRRMWRSRVGQDAR